MIVADRVVSNGVASDASLYLPEPQDAADYADHVAYEQAVRRGMDPDEARRFFLIK